MAKKPGLFYGWWIVAACFLIAAYTAGVIGWGFTAVFEPIKNEFGWTSAQVSYSSSLRGMETGLFAPLVGYMVDRFSARKVIFVGGIITGLGLIVMGRVNSLLSYFLASSLIALGLSLCSANALQAAVAAWFHRKISLALGLMSCGFGFSGLLIPVAVAVVDHSGWRMGEIFFGIGALIIILPLSLLVKRRPEEYGLLPDGDGVVTVSPIPTAIGHVSRKIEDKGKGRGIKKVLASPAFWFIAVAMSGQSLIIGGVSTHVMPYLTSIGYSRGVASFVASGVPIASILGRFSFGWLGDRMNNRKLTISGFAILALGMFCFANAASGLLIIGFFLLFFGIGFGGTNTMRAVLPRTYFGIRGYGTTLGLVMGVGTIGSMLGAPLAGYIYDTQNVYQPAWYLYGAIAIFCLICILLVPASGNLTEAGTETRVPPDGGKE